MPFLDLKMYMFTQIVLPIAIWCNFLKQEVFSILPEEPYFLNCILNLSFHGCVAVVMAVLMLRKSAR